MDSVIPEKPEKLTPLWKLVWAHTFWEMADGYVNSSPKIKKEYRKWKKEYRKRKKAAANGNV